MTWGRWPIALSAALLVWPVAGWAQQSQVAVQSGEHSSFSRLVFPLEGDQTWNLEETGAQRVQIVFDADLPDLDLTRIFDLIPTTRLQNVTQTGSSLDLTLGCDCPVQVGRIPSGHMVIDIQDPPAPTVSSRADLRLPRRLPALPILLRPFPEPTASDPSAPDETPPTPVLDLSRHVAIREHITPGRQTPKVEKTTTSACAFEAIAASHLLADPDAALSALPAARLAVTDAAGDIQSRAYRDMGHLYLDIGWGQEAVLAFRTLPETDPERLAYAAILDAAPIPDGPRPDPACGPASIVAALLSGADSVTPAQINARVLARFIADLPLRRRLDLQPRLRVALETAGAEEALAFLSRPQPADDPPGHPAGTDITTVDAILTSMREIDGFPKNVPEMILVNGLAFRQSLPPGNKLDELDGTLVQALAAGGHINEALQVAEDGVPTPEDILTAALDHLPPGKAAEAAMRLHPHIDRNHPVGDRAAELFADYGLTDTARLFAPTRPDPVDPANGDPAAPADPWLSEDFAAMLDADPETDDPRAAAAQLFADQADDTMADLQGDLARAEAELMAAQRLRTTLMDLLQPPPS